MNSTGYAVGGSSSASASTGASDFQEKAGYWSLEKCKRAYLDYLGNKVEEIEEQKDARRYYHGAQWTADQIKVLRQRRQPVVTFNRISRKINGVVGLLERLKQDPKAFPRTPKHEDGAELATAVLRYCLDEQQWAAKSPEVGIDCAIDGFAGIEIELEQGDQGDTEVGFDLVEPDSFFYDPRSYRADFSDARYMGMGKWLDIEVAQDLFPEYADEIAASATDASELSTNSDREQKWFSFEAGRKLIRLVDIWYQHKGGWCWCIFTGAMKLTEGKSYLFDEKNKPICKYIMFSCNVDHDGDRYGFVRNMKSAQDEYNARRSKSVHIVNSRRLIMTENAVNDVETTRKEWARPDGIVVVNPGNVNEQIRAEDQTADLTGQLRLMENAVSELENYGPNQALIGDIQNQSGRAIQLLQQAGMAELGPFILGYKGWKLRVYRALFGAVQRYWTGERWVRVTDNEGLAQFIQINGVGIDPRTGYPAMVNAIGSLDVDIIIDEGPDTVNAQADVYDTLSQILPSVGKMLSPQEASAAVGILIDTSALPASAKKQFRDARRSAQQPNPMQQQAQQIEMAGAMAKVDETRSKAMLNVANAQAAGMPDQVNPQANPQQTFELPPDVQVMQAMADINETNASRDLKLAQARKAQTDAVLAPAQAAQRASMDQQNFEQGIRDREADRKLAARAPASGS